MLLAVAGGKVNYCFELDDAKLTCFATELATGKTAPTASPASTASSGQPRPRLAGSAPAVSIKNADGGKRPQLCRPDGSKCKTLAMSHAIDQGMGLADAENTEFTLAALGTLQWIDTFDLRTGKRIASFTSGPKRSSCNTLAFAGDTLVIGEGSDCASPARTAWLASKTGKKIGEVGGDAPLVIGTMAPVSGNDFAFAALAGDRVVIQDVVTGKVEKAIAVGAAVPDAPATLVGDAGGLALVFGGARAGDVAVIDAAAGKATTYAGVRCPK